MAKMVAWPHPAWEPPDCWFRYIQCGWGEDHAPHLVGARWEDAAGNVSGFEHRTCLTYAIVQGVIERNG